MRWSRRMRSTGSAPMSLAGISLVAVYGSRITLYIVLLVSVTVGPLGLLLGVSAGYFGGKVDMVLMRVTDIFISFRVWSRRWRLSPL